MRRGIWITVLAVVAFAAIVIARLPASWIAPAPPSAVACADVDGSIWSGSCSGLSAQGTALGDLSWNVHAARLLTGKLSASVVLTRPTGTVQGDFDVGFDKNVTAHHVQGDLPLDQNVKALLPALRNLNGTVNANIAYARVVKGLVTQIEGTIEAHNVETHDRDGVTQLGSYSVTFPGGSGVPTGQLRDLGGPLAVQGTVKVTQDKPGVELEGYVTPRADAPPGLTQQLQYLGSPDSQGRRQFGSSFTF